MSADAAPLLEKQSASGNGLTGLAKRVIKRQFAPVGQADVAVPGHSNYKSPAQLQLALHE
jgi:hypothetical protein